VTINNKDLMVNVLLIGIDYFADRCSSDKNFWHRMLPLLAETIERITVISFNYRTASEEIQPTTCRNIQIFNVRPSHLGIDLHPDSDTVHNKEKCHSHFKSPPRSPIEYLFSFVRIRQLVRRLVAEQNITNVHCMDNFGPAMHLLQRWFLPVPVSVSAMGYYARGPLHDRYLRLCYRGLDAVVPFSVAYRQKLIELGLPEQRLYAIPWGIDDKAVGKAFTTKERAEYKRVLEIEPNCRLVLWTGFIQQIKERDLYASLEIARRIVQQRDDTYFVFALKPECYQPDYQHFAAPRIRVLSTTNEIFLQLLRAADYLLSPIVHTTSIVTPPLTWIEAMALGVPIVTNELPGVGAIVQTGINGFVAESVSAVSSRLNMALSHENQEEMRASAREHVLTHYTIDQSAIRYQTLWQGLQNE
jgi:glycosyltransferase involved in cell wall biosynthesis